MSKKAWLTKMFFHNNKSVVLKVKNLITNYKKNPKRPLHEFNEFIAGVQKEILESNIPKRDHLSKMMGKLLYACNFDRAIIVIHSIPKEGLRWGRVGALGGALSIIMIFFIIL